MFAVGFGAYTVSVHDGELPESYSQYLEHAQFTLEKNVSGSEGKAAFCAVAKGGNWPFCVLAFRYEPAGNGFAPGVLLIPETEILFFGAGTLLLAIDLGRHCQLWEDVADVGFWSWQRHGNTAVMSAELELAAWGIGGEKRWSVFVEPPWSYSVDVDIVTLDVMGNVSKFSLVTGPPAA